MRTLALMFLLAGAVQAQENCGFPTTLTKSGFESGEPRQFVSLPSESTPLSLTVTSPLEGSAVPIDQIQVYGALSGPANMGVLVAGELAWSNATEFTSRPLTLALGPQGISVSVKTMDGAAQSVTRNIVVVPSSSAAVRLRPSATGVYAPALLQFSLRATPPAGQTLITRVQVDYQGDGLFDVDTGSTQVPLSWQYDAPGAYLALARVTFDDGDIKTPPVVREGSYRVQMQSLAFVRQTLCGVFYTMKNRLIANQIPLAINTLEQRIRPRFLTLWSGLGANLPTVAQGLGQVATGQISDVSAEFYIAIPDPANPGSSVGFPVLFTRGTEGVWRIYGM